MAPVAGTVTFNGKPLSHGSVVFHPSKGRPAYGLIQPDGSFELMTHEDGDGALLGEHKVSVICAEEQQATPGDEEATPGKSLIPKKYTSYRTSGITQTVEHGMDPVMIQLVE